MLALGLGLSLLWFTRAPLPWERSIQKDPATREMLARRAQLEAREAGADRTVWSKEMMAEHCGRTIEALWDSLNATTNKLQCLAAFPVAEVVLPDWKTAQPLSHGIELREGATSGRTLSTAQWRQRVEEISREGWQLDNIEFRHNRFETDAQGQPGESHFYFAARLTQAAQSQRALIEGELLVNWTNQPRGQAAPEVRRVDATGLQLKTRTGEPFFEEILHETITPAAKTGLIDPLILYDLDGDGLPEIILAAANLVYHRGDGGRYERGALCRYPVPFISTALIADFDGDGLADLLCANARGLFLFKGSPQGTFDEPAKLVWAAQPPLENAMVLTCGDIDEDGALDVFLGQYKVPTLGQVLRPHYYDANDGYPAYLLRNDGHGNFTDVTSTSGLGSKRWRRTYSASLVDLDGDGHLDLSVMSDFAGMDLYRNDGHGHFSDVTTQWVAEPHGFGMAQALADFNADGRIDLLMIGMPSPTVDRLEALNLHRPYSAEDPVRRPAMAFGNRLLLGKAGGGFDQTALSQSIARSGWSWGCAAFDFDDDGFPDVYIANGLESRQSVQDYESEFWLHDMFINDSVDALAASHYFISKNARTRGAGWSYGGYEKNRLFMNLGAQSFIEVGQLAGVSLEEDSRNVVAADLDGDGLVDLAVTTLSVWPEPKQTLRVYRNKLNDGGHWIGFRFQEKNGHRSPVGARVTVQYGGHLAVRAIVTGDSHRSQSANTIHFGLGKIQIVESAEIHWPGGASLTLTNPSVNQHHQVEAPAF